MNRDLLVVDGRAFSWRRLCELRRQQLEDMKKTEGVQPALFALIDDVRPAIERTAAQRYLAPSLFTVGEPASAVSADRHGLPQAQDTG